MRRPLRVGVVARSVAPLHGTGGLERSVRDLVRYLSSHGVDVTLITRPARQPESDSGYPARKIPALPPSGSPAAAGGPAGRAAGGEIGVTTVFVPYRTFPFAGRRGTTVLDRSTAYPLFAMRAGRAAWRLVRDGRLDLVHGFGASVLGYAWKRRHAGAPLVLNPQGLEEFGATDPARVRLKRLAYLPLRGAVRACAAAADCVIATDRSLAPAVRHHLGVPMDRIRIIPNAVDLPVLDSLTRSISALEIRRRVGIAPDEHVVLSVGRLEHNKGFHVLAAALGAMQAHGAVQLPAWRWIVVGEGPYRTRLERVIAEAGLSARVLLAGRATDHELHAWYEAALLFVHPTLYEGSSLVTLEAMAHRRAVVGSLAGGIPDKIRSGVNGWLVPPGDPGALAAALTRALSDPSRLADMGQAGRRIVEEEFSWDTAGAATLQLYADLLPQSMIPWTTSP